MLIDWCHVAFCYYSRSKISDHFTFCFLHFFFISLFAFFSLLLIFFRDEIPLSNKREKFTFLSFKSLLLFISNNRLKSKKKKNTPTDVINLLGYLWKIELIEHSNIVARCLCHKDRYHTHKQTKKNSLSADINQYYD